MTSHRKLVEMAGQTIRAVFIDQRVSHEQVLESLELLRDWIDGWIDAIREDIEREMKER